MVWAQSPTPSASPPAAAEHAATPFVVDQSQAETGNRAAQPTPTPDLSFPTRPTTGAPPPASPLPSKGGAPKAMPASSQEIITRLQIFLDQRNFGPGKIDGRWGEFTAKALTRYQAANGEKPTGQIDPALEQDLEKIFPIYINYTVLPSDLARVGNSPIKPAEAAKVKAMLYRSLAEFLGERFHSDEDFIAKLNPGTKLDRLTAGAVVRVPNVQPFLIENFHEVGSLPARPEFKARVVKIDTRYRMLDVYEGNKLVCSFPITPGSKKLPAPIGTWKIVGIATMPWFRWDEAMLNHGERSDNFFNIPPGPKNPVGIAWIGLNKRGIGIHGTNSPDTIGRSGSHGCIRLANWDAARVVNEVTPGMTVQIF